MKLVNVEGDKSNIGKIVNVAVAGRTSYTPESVEYNPSLFEQKTGIELDEETQRKILTDLHYEIRNSKSGNWIITPLPSRVDVVIPENIVSDLIRMYGYDKVGLNPLLKTTESVVHNDINISLKEKLANRGLNESITFGFGNSKIEKILTDKPIVKVANPIIVDLDTARNNLIYWLRLQIMKNAVLLI